MSPFFQKVPAYGGLFQAPPYADRLVSDGVTDRLSMPSSATTGFRGARPTFGAVQGLSAKDALMTWRRSVGQIPGVAFLPQSAVSRGVQDAPEAAWDLVWVPVSAMRQARSLAYDAGLEAGFQANVAETGYFSPSGSWLLVTFGRGGPAEFTPASLASMRAGEAKVQALSQAVPTAYGRDEVELTVGSIGYRGDAITAVVLAVIGATVALKG